jgi:hypothetical protein
MNVSPTVSQLIPHPVGQSHSGICVHLGGSCIPMGKNKYESKLKYQHLNMVRAHCNICIVRIVENASNWDLESLRSQDSTQSRYYI